ncbi:MAG: tRNA (N(6)-L-threonylcarbamoyladenosine(37)-C(2))-methylthiotransferase MtaB [Bacteroidia bacterium]|nr:tRNA (N(6)-L-threonylcarbamoyladenosine(37)-C(2))-methylthiotransferase MtaB [Bacteroidia bacterium]
MLNTVAFHTLGCKLNFTETTVIGKQFKAAGFNKVAFDQPSDVYVINTCSVTDNADKECRKLVSKALQLHANAFIIIVGCYAQLKPHEIAAIPGVDLVLGANEKFNVVSYLHTLNKQQQTQVHACEINDVNTFVYAQSETERTRIFLKVQDGCDYTCTFCTIPLARGKSRSDTITNALKRITEAVNNGGREIILTGVNLGDFGYTTDNNEKRSTTFFDLIKAIDALPLEVRIRISSIEPNLLTKEIIDFVAQSKKFVPHFHIPLQSGSDEILKKMRRRYLSKLYADRVAYIKNKMPHACIGVDVIVGFPSETDQHFNETYQFIQQLDVSYLHVFTYSERLNTPAAQMGAVVPVHIRKQRNQMLRILSEKKLRHFYSQQLSNTYEVLFEADNKGGYMHGFTPNYIKVKTPYNVHLVNQIHACELEKIGADGDVEIRLASTEITY